MILRQMDLYARRKLATALSAATSGATYDMLLAMKMMTSSLDALTDENRQRKQALVLGDSHSVIRQRLLRAFKGPTLKAFELWK